MMPMAIIVDEEVKQFIIAEGLDYRLSTTCSGPALVPTLIKPAKPSDIRIPINEFLSLYVSEVQKHFVPRITLDMVYDPEKLYSCSALASLRDIY
jgi:hypothetical protein